MWILRESSSLVSVQENIVNIKRCSNQRLIVCNCCWNSLSNSILTTNCICCRCVATEGCNSPQALINRTDIKVDLDFVVLEGNQRKSQTGVCAKPELKWDVKCCFWKSVSWCANLSWRNRVARSINLSERRICDEGKLGCVTNHLEITALLFSSHCKLGPDVHPVTILAINSLTSNFNLNLSNKLLSWVIQPTSIDTLDVGGRLC